MLYIGIMLMELYQLWGLKDKEVKPTPPGGMAYGIFSTCRRCAYQKSYEPILIFSKDRGPRIIIIPPEGKVFLRQGECIGFKSCGECFNAITSNEFKCKWKEI
jgi:hypothetical protein